MDKKESMTLEDFKKIYSFYDSHGRRSVLVEDIKEYIKLEINSAIEDCINRVQDLGLPSVIFKAIVKAIRDKIK